MDGNYIKLCRSILDWEWYTNENTMRLFVHCLLRANWKDGRFEGMEIPRGSFVTSIPKLADELEITQKQVRTALDHLKKSGEVAVKTTNKFSVITVNNYGQYQDKGSQRADKGQTKGSQRADKGQSKGNNRRREEGKNERREEGKNKYYPNDDKLDEAFRDYVDMRKSIKAPMTDRAVTLAMNNLAKLSTVNGKMDNDLAIAILEQSIMNSWKGLFELKATKKKTNDVFDEWRNA